MIKATVLAMDQVVRIKYNNDTELNDLLKALWKVPGMDVKVNGSER